MKRYVTYCMVLFAMLFADCTTTNEGIDEAQILVLSVDKIDMDYDGGSSKNIEVVSLCEWEATSTEGWTWITPTRKSGAGRTTFNLSIDENTTTDVRTAIITLANPLYGISRDISVTQKAGKPFINITKSEVESTADGTTETITIESNVDYAISSTKSWCKLNTYSGTKGTESLEITIDKNSVPTKRSAVVKIVNNDRSITKEIKVSQDAFGPTLSVNTKSISSPVEGITKKVTIEGNISWAATCDASWVTLTPANGKAGSSTLNVEIASNAETTSRTAKIIVASSEYGITEEIAVSQTELGPALEVSETSISATSIGAKKSITISSNIKWTATCDANWVTLAPVNGGAGTSTLNVEIASNAETTSRIAKIIVAGIEYGITKEIVVSQTEFIPAIYVLNYQTLDLNYSAGEHVIDVDANVSYAYTSNVDWITINRVNTGIKLKYERNNDVNARSGQVVLTNEQYQLTVVIDVTQAAFPSDNVIYYTTTDGGIAILGTSVFGTAKVLSVTNDNGVGIIRFDSPITTIGENAFKYSTNLETITIPSDVTTIDSSAFYGCSSLTDVTIPNSVTTIGNSAFYECSALANLSIPNSVTSIGEEIFYNCSALTSISIPNSVTEIPEYTFYGCNSLASISIPTSVTSIGSYAFHDCSELSNIVIPENVNTIGSYAFQDCSKLTTIMIPESVTSIGTYAFYDCSELSSIYCASTTPPTGGSSMFNNNASGRKIYVKPESVSTYQSASYWSNYSSYIEVVPYTVTRCTSLVIEADDVDWDATTTTIHYTAIVDATSIFGSHTNFEETGTATSSPFEQNTSSTSITRTISFTYHDMTDYTSITQRAKPVKKYTVDLNSQWRESSSVSNPNSSTYDGVYESYSNYNKSNSSAWMYINIEGYDTFTIYVRSNAESSYDYVTVYNLDSTSSAKMTTSRNQQSGTSISSYTAVTFSNISEGTHRIAIKYSKDGSYNEGSDRGYVLIPKNQ